MSKMQVNSKMGVVRILIEYQGSICDIADGVIRSQLASSLQCTFIFILRMRAIAFKFMVCIYKYVSLASWGNPFAAIPGLDLASRWLCKTLSDRMY